MCSKSYVAGGPIFFYLGNEADVTLYLNHTGLMWENADKFGALLVFAEHRYYGQSKPFPSSTVREHMQWLTTEQALSDYASLVFELRENYLKDPDAPVIGFGGSYGGMLATWFRLKYPHAIDGAIAGSAPIWTFLGERPAYDPSGFARVVTRDATAEGGAAPECADNVRAAWQALFALAKTADGRKRASEALGLCPSSAEAFDSPDLAEDVASALSAAWDYLAMGDYPYPSSYMLDGGGQLPAFPVRAACESLRGRELATGDPVVLLEKLAEAANLFFNASGDQPCFDAGLEAASRSVRGRRRAMEEDLLSRGVSERITQRYGIDVSSYLDADPAARPDDASRSLSLPAAAAAAAEANAGATDVLGRRGRIGSLREPVHPEASSTATQVADALYLAAEEAVDVYAAASEHAKDGLKARLAEAKAEARSAAPLLDLSALAGSLPAAVGLAARAADSVAVAFDQARQYLSAMVDNATVAAPSLAHSTPPSPPPSPSPSPSPFSETADFWDWQACTEQFMPMTRDGKRDMFWSQPWDDDAEKARCEDVWGATPRPLHATIEWGGRSLPTASNIVFSNGLLDPWSAGGVLRDLSESVVAVLIPEGAHHLDLMFSHPLDPPSVIEARKVELQHIARWIDEKRAAVEARKAVA